MKKRILAILLACAVVITMIPALTFAGLGNYGDQGDFSTQEGRKIHMVKPERISYEGSVVTTDSDGSEVEVITNRICDGLDSAYGAIEFSMYQNGGINNRLHTLFTPQTTWIEDANGEVVLELQDMGENNTVPTGNVETTKGDPNVDGGTNIYNAKVFVGDELENCQKYTLVFDKTYGGNRMLTKQLRFDFIYNGVHPNKVDIKADRDYLFQGHTLQLTGAVKPNGSNNVATNQDVFWTSLTPEVAVVDENGLVTGVGEGTATIEVETVDQTNAEALGRISNTINLEVRDEVGVQSIEVVNRLTAGEKFRLEATAQPVDAPDPSVEWTSSNPAVATVDANGVVKGVAVGQTMVTAVAKNGVKSKETPVRVAPAKTTLSLSAKTKAVKLTYKKKTGAQFYEFYRSESKTGDYELIATRDSSVSTSWTDTDLLKKKTYYYKVRSYAEIDGVKIYSDFSDVKYKKTK